MHILWHEQQQHDKTRAVVVRKARVTHRSRPVCEAEQIHAKRRGRDQSHVGHVLRKAVRLSNPTINGLRDGEKPKVVRQMGTEAKRQHQDDVIV
jgi:hypothetical protein